MSTPTVERRTLPTLPLPTQIIGQGRSAILWRWILSRTLTLALLGIEGGVAGDVFYYARSMDQLFHGGTLRTTLQEYPLPVLGLLVPQYLVGFLRQTSFVVLFVLSMLAVDAIFTSVLWRADGRRRGDATNLWLWFVPAIGPLAYWRFDLVPAMLAGGAVLVAIRRPAFAGALTAIGAALKLWPVAMIPTFLIRRTDRRPVLVGFIGTLGAITAGAVIVGGLDRLKSPLEWQSARGLQIESIAATPLMLARAVNPSRWDVHVSQYKSNEIFGPGVHTLVSLSNVLTLLGGLVLVALWIRAVRAPVASAEALGWIFLSTVLIVTITNKTLSPQYLLWLGGPIAALAVRAPHDDAVRSFGRTLLVTAVATQLVFPVAYHSIVTEGGGLIPGTLLLAARNVLLIYLTWFSIRQTWVRTRWTALAE
jgi:hypothetical protein